MAETPAEKDGRSTNKDGRVHKVRNDKHVGTFEDQFGVDTGLNSNAHLKTAFERYGLPDDASENALLEAIKEGKK